MAADGLSGLSQIGDRGNRERQSFARMVPGHSGAGPLPHEEILDAWLPFLAGLF
jgi:hypothetical protein